MLSFTVSKRYFYVDTECFKNLDFIDAFLLNEDDFIVLFGNENDNKLSIRDLKKLFKCRSNLGFKEIQIDTKEEYRRKGLALICGAKLIIECLNKELYPSWDAQNMESVKLSEKLGYHFDKEYTAYEISKY